MKSNTIQLTLSDYINVYDNKYSIHAIKIKYDDRSSYEYKVLFCLYPVLTAPLVIYCVVVV